MRKFLRQTYAVFTWILFAAVIVQFFLAGMGVFVSPADFATHAIFGSFILFAGVLDVLLALAARLPWRTTGWTALVPLLVIVQVLLVEFGRSLHVLAAFHVVNALIIFTVMGYVALQARAIFAGREPSQAAVTSQTREAHS